jgi:hypothetical protein
LVNRGKERKPECERLPGAGRCLAGNVLAGKDVWDRGCLDGKWLDDSAFSESADERVG